MGKLFLDSIFPDIIAREFSHALITFEGVYNISSPLNLKQ
jgi:hypothetical protein